MTIPDTPLSTRLILAVAPDSPLPSAPSIDVTDAVRHIFDALVQSLDYGSGFLDNEDMQAIIQVAEVLRISTPELLDLRADFRKSVVNASATGARHAFEPDRLGDPANPTRSRCLVCGWHASFYIHELNPSPPACPVCRSTVHTDLPSHEAAERQVAHGMYDPTIHDPIFAVYLYDQRVRAEADAQAARLAQDIIDPEDF